LDQFGFRNSLDPEEILVYKISQNAKVSPAEHPISSAKTKPIMQIFSHFVLLFMASAAFATPSSDTAVSYSSYIISHLNIYDRNVPLIHKQSNSFVPTALAPQIISIPPTPKKCLTPSITWAIVKKARQVVSFQSNIQALFPCTVHTALELGITSTPPTRPR